MSALVPAFFFLYSGAQWEKVGFCGGISPKYEAKNVQRNFDS